MYVLLWRTVSALTRVLFWYLSPSLLRNSGNKHQNNYLVGAETIRHSSAYIIVYLLLISGAYIVVFGIKCIHWEWLATLARWGQEQWLGVSGACDSNNLGISPGQAQHHFYIM